MIKSSRCWQLALIIISSKKGSDTHLMRQAAEIIGHNTCNGTGAGPLALFSLNIMHELLVADLCSCLVQNEQNDERAHNRASLRHDHNPERCLDLFDQARITITTWVPLATVTYRVQGVKKNKTNRVLLESYYDCTTRRFVFLCEVWNSLLVSID